MNFEQESNEYLQLLVSGGTIVSGDLTGVSETRELSEAIVTFDVNGHFKQKRIMIRRVDGNLTWNYISHLSQNEIAETTDGWSFPDYSKRIIAPVALIMDDTGIKIYGWFQVQNLPIKTVGDNVHLYCNKILPAHQNIVDAYQGVITIENRP